MNDKLDTKDHPELVEQTENGPRPEDGDQTYVPQDPKYRVESDG